MTLERDMERLAQQEELLRFASFDNATAWQLGQKIKALSEARQLALTIEVRLGGETVFFHAMAGTTPGNADWARRKRNTVELLHKSSYAVGRALEREGSSLDRKMGLALRDYASHGGSFPIRVKAVGGCVGTVTVSGAPQRQDHAILVEVLAELCDVALTQVTLDD